jgi:hypothetical protein
VSGDCVLGWSTWCDTSFCVRSKKRDFGIGHAPIYGPKRFWTSVSPLDKETVWLGGSNWPENGGTHYWDVTGCFSVRCLLAPLWELTQLIQWTIIMGGKTYRRSLRDPSRLFGSFKFDIQQESAMGRSESFWVKFTSQIRFRDRFHQAPALK